MGRRRRSGSDPRRGVAGRPAAPALPDIGAVRAAAAGALGVALLASVLALAFGAGRLWSLPSGTGAGKAVALGVALGCTLSGALLAWRRLSDVRPRAARVGGTIAVALALTAILSRIVPPTYIGDWQWILWIAEDGKPLGKWYGASLVYVYGHRVLGGLAGLTPFESVRWTSAACGAATAWVWYRIVDGFGWTRRAAAWPALYLSAFGVIGIGLGHLEVYAPVGLLIGLYLWTGWRLLEAPDRRRFWAFAAVAGLATGAYVAMLLLVPVTLAVIGKAASGLRGSAAKRGLLAVAAVALMVLPVTAEKVAGPEPIQGHLIDFWRAQAARDAEHLPRAKAFQPSDVYWPLVPNFMAPKYWFSGWHLSDIGQQALLDDRAGLALAIALAVLLASKARSGFRDPRVALPLALSAVLLAYGFTVVNGRPYPWDWDLFSYAALPVNVLAAGLLTHLLGERPLGRVPEALLAAAGLTAAVAGVAFFLSVPRTPSEFGPPRGGLRLAVVPERFALAPGRPAHLWLWLANDTDEPRHVRPGRITYALVGESASSVLRQPPRRRAVVGGRWVPAHGVACLHDFTYDPAAVRIGPRAGGAEDLRPLAASAGPDLFLGRLWVDLGRDGGRLRSNPLEIATAPAH
ncbi:MAG: hypothetical protein D6718_10435 [Acidobacteria bacterium]|nr:MAG: hypothetical protein D6718_10435 [Acidobacteriota bacterium]